MASSFYILYICLICLGSNVFAQHSSTSQVTIALRHRNLAELETLFWRIADPSDSLYGKHFDLKSLRAYGCDDETLTKIVKWLKVAGAANVEVSPANDMIKAEVPATLALKLYRMHKDASIRAQISSQVAFDVTSIDFVVATQVTSYNTVVSQTSSNSPTFGNKLALHNAKSKATKSGTPSNQRAAYGIPANLVGTNRTNSQLVWGPGTYGYLPDDLATYYKRFSVQTNISYVSRYGYAGVPGGDNFGEASLDVQVISGIAPQVRTIVSNTDNSSSAEEGYGFGPAFLHFAMDLNSNPAPPYVVSLSLGSLSWDSCDILCKAVVNISNGETTYAECDQYMQSQRQVCMYPDSAQMDRINVELMKLGARGVTIVAATGDGGSHFSFQRFPEDKIGKMLNTASCEYNLPTFPAESPYVLGVGGTDWTQGGSSHPVAWGASGSGFSWRYPVAPHQQSAVNNYLHQQKSKLPPLSSFNMTNRAYPDVAALATDVPIVSGGQTFGVGGTSASTPAWGGVISLLNDARLNKGLPPLGFIAPRLYEIAEIYPGQAFYDMSSGSSACDSTGFCCSSGFTAAPGWDPTTGLGRPVWAGLLALLETDSD